VIVAGLTGSIGMGKSTVAAMFADEGVPVHDADATVHALYSGAAAPLIEQAFPGTASSGRVDRLKLGAIVLADAAAMARLESIVHPLVRAEEQRFLERQRQAGAPLVILDIPLLFETGRDSDVSQIVVVSAGEEAQRERVLKRPGMTEDKFRAILARQVSDAEKRRRATHVVDTSGSLEDTRMQVRRIAHALGAKRG
jgi:dephospho-CoA kinase